MSDRFDQLIAASSRINAERRQPLPQRSPTETAAAFKALAFGVLKGMHDARISDPGARHMLRSSLRTYEVASLALAAFYRRRAAEALAKGVVREMLVATVEALDSEAA